MSLPNPSMSFSPFAILTAEEMNELAENDQALAAGTGLDNNAVTTAKIADAGVTNAKLATGAGQPGGAWTAWSPTWSGVTVGNGTVVARYSQTGKTVSCYVSFQLGNTSSISGAIGFSLPVTARAVTSTPLTGNSYIEDNSTAAYTGFFRQDSTSLCGLYAANVAGTYLNLNAATATVPFSWGNTDFFTGFFRYEAA